MAHVVLSLDFSFSFWKKRDLDQVVFKDPSSYGFVNERSVLKNQNVDFLISRFPVDFLNFHMGEPIRVG